MMLADVQLRLESVSVEVKALRALVAETKEPERPPDGMEDRDAGSWLTVASIDKKRSKAPVVVKLKGTSASIRKGSVRQNFVDKTCIFENDVSGLEVGKALLKLSPDGIHDMTTTLPPGVVDQFMSLQPKFKTIHEIQTSSSSSSSGEGNVPVEFCG